MAETLPRKAERPVERSACESPEEHDILEVYIMGKGGKALALHHLNLPKAFSPSIPLVNPL